MMNTTETGASYSQFPKEKLILRDHLAADRTILANERTLLAYIRTALAILIAGLSLIEFFNPFIFKTIGWILIPFGFITFSIGLKRYIKINRIIKNVTNEMALLQ